MTSMPFQISLAEWSLNKPIFAGVFDHLDFARIARGLEISAVEYVNRFFKDKASDREYLREMNRRADGEGVVQVLIMCDAEGQLGDPDPDARRQAVENHFKWVEAAAFLRCRAIRVNGFSRGSADEQQALVADGIRRLCEFADPHGIDVVIENHGGYSSNARWLMRTLRQVDHPRAGTLPDFGNFRISGPTAQDPDLPLETYDSYVGVMEMMPLARGVSVKPMVYDAQGNRGQIDLFRMMRIVVEAGYHGYCGIEHGPEGAELQGIVELRQQLEDVRTRLT